MITERKKDLKMCHKAGEIQENCDPWRKPGEGSKKQLFPEKIGRVGKYAHTLPLVYVTQGNHRIKSV